MEFAPAIGAENHAGHRGAVYLVQLLVNMHRHFVSSLGKIWFWRQPHIFIRLISVRRLLFWRDR